MTGYYSNSIPLNVLPCHHLSNQYLLSQGKIDCLEKISREEQQALEEVSIEVLVTLQAKVKDSTAFIIDPFEGQMIIVL
jgi:hypothetical protein